ncbi:MAG: oxygen-independent coproporphyrinogen oxidase [Pseudomonadota bacterium]|jgi:oxygen-independent coproporphyrinogen-3 oxidase
MSLPISESLLERYDIPGPRYTSYPTADRFVEAFGPEDLCNALTDRRETRSATALSIYVHIPFCESVCYYCACNKVITKHHSKGAEYLHYLSREIDLITQHLGLGQKVSQLHLGGGSPTFLSDAELGDVMSMLQRNFELVPGGEYSIEIDPRTVTDLRLEHLHRLGFNRLSFGVQDFDPQVQVAIHRVQPRFQVEALMHSARRIGYESINLDLIYGLPLQTPESFERTLDDVILLRPDRVAIYAYAHLPTRFKPQRRINAHELPSPQGKVHMLALAIDRLTQAGYVYIGMDHFALPNDPLAVAKAQGRLHRNFQGYSTQPDCDLVALGVSAIGRIGPTYSQNAKTLEEYYDCIDQGRLPVVRGLALTPEDILRRAVIMAIMCQGKLDFEAIELAFMTDFRRTFAHALARLEPLIQEGLVELDEQGLQVTQSGWMLVRAIAMVFDQYLQSDLDRARFSKIL